MAAAATATTTTTTASTSRDTSQSKRARETKRDQSAHTSTQFTAKQKPYLVPTVLELCAAFSSILFIISLSVSVGCVQRCAFVSSSSFFLIWNGKTISVQLTFGVLRCFSLFALSLFLFAKVCVCVKNLLLNSFIRARMVLSSFGPRYCFASLLFFFPFSRCAPRFERTMCFAVFFCFVRSGFIYFSIACASDLCCCFSGRVRDSAHRSSAFFALFI